MPVWLVMNKTTQAKDPFIATEQDNGENRFGQAAYWVDYTLAPFKEQPEKVQKMLYTFKTKYGIN